MRHIFMTLLALGLLLLETNGASQGQVRKPNPQQQMQGKSTDYEFVVPESVKVRTLEPPPPEFDEKGKLKKYTPEELKAMKGTDPADQRLPGYKLAFNELRVGDVVQVSISKPKSAPGAAPAPKPKKDGEGDGEEKTTKAAPAAAPTQWTPVSQMQGTIARFNDGPTKEVTVRVSANGMPAYPGRPQQGGGDKGKPGGERGGEKGGNNNAANTQVVEPARGQVTMIVISQRGPAEQEKKGRDKKK